MRGAAAPATKRRATSSQTRAQLRAPVANRIEHVQRCAAGEVRALQARQTREACQATRQRAAFRRDLRVDDDALQIRLHERAEQRSRVTATQAARDVRQRLHAQQLRARCVQAREGRIAEHSDPTATHQGALEPRGLGCAAARNQQQDQRAPQV